MAPVSDPKEQVLISHITQITFHVARILRIGMVDHPYPEILRIDCDAQEFLIFNDFGKVGPRLYLRGYWELEARM